LQRVQIERSACTEPSAYGLHVARWDSRTLQQVVVEQAVKGAMHTIRPSPGSWPPPARSPTGVAMGRP
jgi:hypothetical protein